MNKKCLHCKQKFTFKNNKKKYCSKYCNGAFLAKFKRKFKDVEQKNCVYCNKKIIDKSFNKIKRFCSKFCCTEDYKKQGKRKLSLSKYNRTQKAILAKKKYALSKKGILNRIKRSKILNKNLKIVRKINRKKNKNIKLNKKELDHFKKFEKYILSRQKQCKKYITRPEVKERKRQLSKKYYKNPKFKKKLQEYRKRFYSLPENKLKRVASTNKRRAIKLKAIPKWCNLDRIKEIYKNCPKGYHVDHIVPLQGKNVCGLHVENNLQYLTAEQNIAKGNKLINL